MDGGAGICAEQYQNFISKKSSFLLSIKEVLSGWLSVLPCCIQREADEITTLLIAAFAVEPEALFRVVRVFRGEELDSRLRTQDAGHLGAA